MSVEFDDPSQHNFELLVIVAAMYRRAVVKMLNSDWISMRIIVDDVGTFIINDIVDEIVTCGMALRSTPMLIFSILIKM